MKIIKCIDCGYTGLTSIDRDVCKHCSGKLEIIAEELKKQKEDLYE